MQIFDEARVRALLRFDTLIPAMERALTDLSAGRVQQPVRSIIPVTAHAGLFGLMPAVYGDVLGAKLVTVYPANAARGLTTGEPLATLDGRLITEMRTAAVSAVATRLLSRPDAHVLAILGSGVQARSHVTALRLVLIVDPDRDQRAAAQRAAVTDLVAQRGVGMSELAMDGEHPLVRLAGVIQLVDYASVYLAIGGAAIFALTPR